MIAYISSLVLVATAVTAMPGNNGNRVQGGPPAAAVPLPAAVEKNSEPSVLEIAIGNPDFSTLVAAVKAAGLVETLSGDGPFTIFAPNNAAFAKFDSDVLADLLEKPEELKTILLRHVVINNIPSAEVPSGVTELVTAGGSDTITVTRTGNNITVETEAGSAKVIAADVLGSNGVIHVIDTVV